MTPITQKRFQRIVSFLQKKQAATVKQISAATNLPNGTVRTILDYQNHFDCHKVAGQSSLFSLREPLPAKERLARTAPERVVSSRILDFSGSHFRSAVVLCSLDRTSGGSVMMKSEAEQSLPEAERRAIFLALVEAQDAGDNVLQSRRAIADRFKISDGLVRRIEREGLDAHWPPLE
jgi:hypothetical protein